MSGVEVVGLIFAAVGAQRRLEKNETNLQYSMRISRRRIAEDYELRYERLEDNLRSHFRRGDGKLGCGIYGSTSLLMNIFRYRPSPTVFSLNRLQRKLIDSLTSLVNGNAVDLNSLFTTSENSCVQTMSILSEQIQRLMPATPINTPFVSNTTFVSITANSAGNNPVPDRLRGTVTLGLPSAASTAGSGFMARKTQFGGRIASVGLRSDPLPEDQAVVLRDAFGFLHIKAAT
ncbi:hypothetical protein MMC06_004472 [Schaereria dolodes]|nr:hypothetical protein [Schaereria dolodes]